MRRSRAEDPHLLAAAAAGDEEAFSVFYRRWLPAVTGFFLRSTGSRELAFDLTAETFAAVVSSIASYDSQRGAPSGWLFGIAEHKLRDSQRHARAESSARSALGHQPIRLDDHDLERVEELASLENPDRLRRSLAQLPSEQREAVIARVLDDRPFGDIAAEMDCSPAVVRQRVHRGLSRLRERLQEPS